MLSHLQFIVTKNRVAVMCNLLLIVCWAIAVPGVLLALLIILPAPSYLLWMVAVVISEWSVWLALAGLVSAACGASVLIMYRGSALAWAGITLNLVMVACAGTPVIEAYRIARQEGVKLSWSRYLFGAQDTSASIAVEEQHDVVFANPNGHPLRLDVYQPRYVSVRHPQDAETTTALLPAIIVIHGGSWNGGAKSDFARYDRWLAESGRVVFDVEYRLANSSQHFPAQLIDIKCAIVWVKSQAARYRIDPERLALLGRSAGGQMALLAAYTANDPTLQTHDCNAQDTRVRAVISFYGPTDLVWDYTHPGYPDVVDTQHVLENYLGGSPSSAPQAYTSASPIAHVSAQSPPTLFLHGGHDQLVRAENVERLLPKLSAAGVPAIYIYLPWANHGFDYNFNGWSSQITQAEISRFLNTYL